MKPPASASEENRRLRQTVRDLAALSALPAVWSGLGPDQLASSLADVLLHTLSLDLIYVRLAALDGDGVVECLRRKDGTSAAPVDAARVALAPLFTTDHTASSVMVSDPFGDGPLHVTVTRFGGSDCQGVLVSGSCSPDFPTEWDRALLGVAANQAAIVLEQRRAEEAIRANQARKSAILETALDCVITMDHQGKVLDFNPAAERTFGYSRGDVIGRELADLIIPPSLRERHRQGMAHYLATGEGPVLGKRLELPALRADGSEFPVELAITRISTDGPPMFTAYLRDITDRKRSEQHRSIRLAVTQALSDAPTVDEGATGVLRAVCANLGWDAGFFWKVNGARTALTCRRSWHRDDVPVSEFEVASFARTFEKGEGLPGHVWSTGKPRWLIDVVRDADFPRAASAAKYDLHSAIACPVMIGDRVSGVIEFFTRRIREPEADLLEMMGTVAGSLGQFIERKTAEDDVRRSEQELADFFENATVGLHWVGPDGIILRANRAELDMLGYSSEEYVGRHVADFHADADVIGDILRRLRNGEKLHDYPAGLRCKDGSIKDVVIDSSALFQEGGFVHTRCFTRDVTERKRAEASVRDQEQRTRTILESITDAFCALDRDWRFAYLNRKAEGLLGRSRNDLIGKNIWEEYPATLGTDLESSYRRAVTENVTVALQYFHPPQDRWYEVHAYPSPDGLSVYYRDISEKKQAEEQLRQSEERFRSIFGQTVAGVAQTDMTGRFVLVNQRYCEIVGRPPEELTALRMQDITHPTDLPRNLPLFQAMVDGGPPFDIEKRYVRPDGSHVWVNNSVSLIRDGDGRPKYVVAVAMDITDRKRAEGALRESEEKLRLLADTIPQLAWMARPDGHIFWYNRRWYEYTGTTPEAMEGWGWQSVHDPEALPKVLDRWQGSIASGEPFDMVFPLKGADQQFRPFLTRVNPLRDEGGRTLYWFGTNTDISEQQRAEERSRFLAEASAELAAVVDYESALQKVANLAVPYFADWSAVDLADEHGNLRRLAVAHQHADKVALVHELMREYPPDPQSTTGGYAVLRTGAPQIISEIPDEMLSQVAQDERHLDLIRSLGLKSYICVPLIASGTTLGLLTFATAESGRKFTESDLALAMDLAHRAAVAIENTKLYQVLKETDRRKDEFLATLAHELRNPLAPVRNALEILKMPRVDPQTAERSREIMERQVQHLVRLVDDLLDMSRVMRGKIDLRREQVELASIVAAAVETVQPLVDAQGHQLNVRVSPESLLLDGDPVRLAQIVGNLLTNAAKYTEANGQIWLTGERAGDMVVLRVRDNGIGIAPHMIPRVFELFAQVDHAATKSQGGLGIGLTLVKNLVEMHNGIIDARSDGLGQGSEFVVKLPLVAQSIGRERAPEAEQQAYAFPPPSGKRLLVVDDNQDAANSLAMLLKLQRHEVRVAYSGMAALEMIKTYSPDVVLLDIGMAGLDGYEVARQIRQTPGLGHVVLAALTGWGQQEDRRRTAEAGFDHHLVKPPAPEVLAKLLEK